MPVTYNLRNLNCIDATALALRNSAERLEHVVSAMKEAGVQEAYFPWAARHDELFQLVVEFASQCEVSIESQVLAKQQGLPSRFTQIKTRSARDVAARKLRLGDVPPRPRGRPRKVVS